METMGVNLAPLIPNVPKIKEPDFDSNFFGERSNSRWRELKDELGYYLESAEYIKEFTCYDELLLKNRE